MKNAYRKTLLVGMMAIMPFLLAGCFLQHLSGFQRIIFDDLTEEIEAIFAALDADATVAICSPSETPEGDVRFECTYIVEGMIISSTWALRSEFGLEGVIIDPIILQVPEGATSFSGTFDDGSGPQPIVTTELAGFMADAATEVLPEPGMKFVVLEFPDSEIPNITTTDTLNGHPYGFSLEFDTGVTQLAPLEIKAMYTAKVQMGGESFYMPMLPCTTDFAEVPAFVLPATRVPEDLMLQYFQGIFSGQAAPCDGTVYDLTGVDVTNPGITIEKSPDAQTVTAGSEAVFQIRVENTGDVALEDVTVADALTPDCDAVLGTLTPGQVVTYECAASGVTADFVNVASVSATAPGGPAGGVADEDSAAVTVSPVSGEPLDCTAAVPSIGLIWPPDHRMVPVLITGITAPDGGEATVHVDGIRQDEPLNATGDGSFAPDGAGVGTDTAHVRAERQGGGNGRVYHIEFTASGGDGGTCSGVVTVGVPHNLGRGATPVDDGPLYDSTGAVE